MSRDSHDRHVARLGFGQFSDCGVAQVVEAAVEAGLLESTPPSCPPPFCRTCRVDLHVFAPRKYVVFRPGIWETASPTDERLECHNVQRNHPPFAGVRLALANYKRTLFEIHLF